jgi:hypothetical protein
MKKFTLTLCFLSIFSPLFFLHAQIKMGNRPLEIDPLAIFEIESKSQGVLLPRMSSLERDQAFTESIPHGLLIFNSTTNQFEFYDAEQKKWSPFQTPEPKLTLQDNYLFLSEDNGVDLSPWLDNTDSQQLRLEGNRLILENGGSVDLSPLFTPNKDEQRLSLANTQLILERGGSVDLAPLLASNSNQKVDHFKLISNTLELSLSSDGEPPHQLNINGINTDRQQLSLTSNTLILQNGGQVDLSKYTTNTDSQKITLSVPNSSTLSLNISNGNSITLTNSGSLTFTKTASNLALIKAPQSPFTLNQNTVSNQFQQWGVDDFVFGSPQLDNDTATTTDNKRMFFDKSKAAFRAGFAQSDQWDDQNRGTYSVAMGRNTVASGFHSTAFGLSTKSKAWYSTTMGQGTVAASRSETAIGSFNSDYTPSGGTNKWIGTDRLFVVGNGTGTSTVSRSDALIIFKDGTATTTGVWTGPGFKIISDKKLKNNIKTMGPQLSKFLKLQPKQFVFTKREKIQFGFIAQELEKIYPELVSKLPEKDSLKSIDYSGLIPILVEVVQQQQKDIEELKKKFLK